MTTETKSEKFRRLSGARLPKVLHSIGLLKNLAGSAYEATPREAQDLVDQLTAAVEDVAEAFKVNASGGTLWTKFHKFIAPAEDDDNLPNDDDLPNVVEDDLPNDFVFAPDAGPCVVRFVFAPDAGPCVGLPGRGGGLGVDGFDRAEIRRALALMDKKAPGVPELRKVVLGWAPVSR